MEPATFFAYFSHSYTVPSACVCWTHHLAFSMFYPRRFRLLSQIADSVSRLRALELTALQRLLNLRGFNLAILFTWPTLVSLLTFAVFVLIGEQLTVPKTFSVLVRAQPFAA